MTVTLDAAETADISDSSPAAPLPFNFGGLPPELRRQVGALLMQDYTPTVEPVGQTLTFASASPITRDATDLGIKPFTRIVYNSIWPLTKGWRHTMVEEDYEDSSALCGPGLIQQVMHSRIGVEMDKTVSPPKGVRQIDIHPLVVNAPIGSDTDTGADTGSKWESAKDSDPGAGSAAARLAKWRDCLEARDDRIAAWHFDRSIKAYQEQHAADNPGGSANQSTLTSEGTSEISGQHSQSVSPPHLTDLEKITYYPALASPQSSGSRIALDRISKSESAPPRVPDQTNHALNTASALSRAAARLGVELEVDVRGRMPLSPRQIRGSWSGRHGHVAIIGSPDDAVADFVPRPLVSPSTRVDGDLDVTIKWRLPTEGSQVQSGDRVLTEESLKRIAHSRYLFQELGHLHNVEYKPWTMLFDSPSDTANLCQSTAHGLVRALKSVGESNDQFSIVKSDGLALPEDSEPLFEIGNQTVLGKIDWDNHSEWQW